jgi:hypothetical protein
MHTSMGIEYEPTDSLAHIKPSPPTLFALSTAVPFDPPPSKSWMIQSGHQPSATRALGGLIWTSIHHECDPP